MARRRRRASYFSGLFSANVTDGEAPETLDLAGFGENWKESNKKWNEVALNKEEVKRGWMTDENNLGAKNRPGRLYTRVNTVRLGSRALQNIQGVGKGKTRKQEKRIKSKKPVCRMGAVRPLVWSRWRAGPWKAPPPAAQAASWKG